MATFYIRDRKLGDEIVNAVECGDQITADRCAADLLGDCWADAHPPLEVLQRYRYWDERP